MGRARQYPMKHQFFAQDASSIRAELSKQENKYLEAIERGAASADLESIKLRILMLDKQLKRAATGYQGK